MKKILVIGGSRGIGHATAILAGGRGWTVALSYVRDAAAAARTVEEIKSSGSQAFAFRADIAEEADVIELFAQARAAMGGIDGVVINAGIAAASMPLAEMTGERLRRVFDVNILGAYLCAREAARCLSTDRGGSGGAIVIVSSISSRLGAPFDFVDYAGSKGAMDTLTIGLAKELGPAGVRVNAVRPGLIETEIHASAGQPDRAQRLGANAPLGRAGTAEETGQAILWLLGEDSSYVTGALLDIAGGR